MPNPCQHMGRSFGFPLGSKINISIMENKTLKEIVEMNTNALTTIIDFWREHEPFTVLLAYAELKRRNHDINEILNYRITEFCLKNNYYNINSFLSTELQKLGYNSFDEYCEKEINTKKTDASGVVSEGVQEKSNVKYNTEKKYPILRLIRQLLKIIGYLLIVGVLYTSYKFFQNPFVGWFVGLKELFNGFLAVLGVFALAESIAVIIDIEYNTRVNKKE